MKTVNIDINLYSFEELSQESKDKAVYEHRGFLLEITRPKDFETDEDFNQYMEDVEYDDCIVIDSIVLNDYLYFEDGELADYCTFWNGNHKVKTEFYFMNKVYIL